MTNSDLPTFNSTTPPLMKDHPNDFSIKESAEVEIASYTYEGDDRNTINDPQYSGLSPLIPDRLIKERQREDVKKYVLTRRQKWVLLFGPKYYPDSITITLKEANGITKTESQKMSKALSVTAGASGFGFSAEVSASLNIEDSTTEEYMEYTESTITKPAEGGNYYADWGIVDTYELTRYAKDGDVDVITSMTAHSTQTFLDKYERPSDD